MKIAKWIMSGCGAALAIAASGAGLDTNRIERITGLNGTWSASEKVFKVSSPRNDVKVSVDGWTMPPFLGLTSWAAFTGMGERVMVMGDIVLLQDEVNSAMSAALDNGLSVTALHNHFFYDEPKVYFMHVGGDGDAVKLAEGVRKVLDTVKAARAANPKPATTFGAPPLASENSITAGPLETIFGLKGQQDHGMFKVVVGLTTKMSGMPMGKEMGVNTWAAFAGNDANAVVDGDFAVHENELQGVLKSLRHNGVNIVAIHSHMTDENPRILFLHYWGRGKASDLARAVKAALDTQGK